MTRTVAVFAQGWGGGGVEKALVVEADPWQSRFPTTSCVRPHKRLWPASFSVGSLWPPNVNGPRLRAHVNLAVAECLANR